MDNPQTTDYDPGGNKTKVDFSVFIERRIKLRM